MSSCLSRPSHLAQFVLFGTDKTKVAQLGVDIRDKRKPEPYKGNMRLSSSSCRLGQLLIDYVQGVFVGDEKIKMKSGMKE